MNDLLRVHVGNPLGNLSSDDWGGLLLELPLNRQVLEQVPLGAQLHEKVDPCLVVEEIVEFDDIGVVEVQLDLDLVKELLFHLLLTWTLKSEYVLFFDDF